MALRVAAGVEKQMPGITGWAQINGRDSISLEEKVALEKYYLDNQSLALDLKILWRTLFKVSGRPERVSLNKIPTEIVS